MSFDPLSIEWHHDYCIINNNWIKSRICKRKSIKTKVGIITKSRWEIMWKITLHFNVPMYYAISLVYILLTVNSLGYTQRWVLLCSLRTMGCSRVGVDILIWGYFYCNEQFWTLALLQVSFFHTFTHSCNGVSYISYTNVRCAWM